MTNRLGEHLGPMTAIIFVFVFLILELTSVAAAESNSSALAPVTTFFADYNKHDIQAASALFDQELSLTDAFPPFHWRREERVHRVDVGPR
jgi:hypothetical protein